MSRIPKKLLLQERERDDVERKSEDSKNWGFELEQPKIKLEKRKQFERPESMKNIFFLLLNREIRVVVSGARME
jgi:hypothetical protein